MIQRCQQTRFAFQPTAAVGVGGELPGQDLDRDVAPELRVAGAVDLPHPART
jgi:hypothetical protein